MRITRLLLEKYKRLMLSNINYLDYNPSNAVMQLLIGRNGSGKSSLIEELTPLPTHHSHFFKGGRRLFEGTHRESTYVLDSQYNGGSGHHSFLKDGVELNKGGTMAVQKELVKTEFGITRDIHELLVGITPFTSLSTAKRREWLTALSPADLSYAFNVFQRAKTKHRDQLGVIKHVTKRMGRENHDLADDQELTRLRRETDRLTQRLNDLFEFRKAGVESRFRNQDDLEHRVKQATEDARKALRSTPPEPPVTGINSAEALREHISAAQADVQSQQALIDRMTEEHQQLVDQAPARDEQLSESQIAELRIEADRYREQETQHRTQVDAYQDVFPLIDLPPDRRPRETLEDTFAAWMELLHQFPNNPDGRLNRDKGEGAKERLTELTGWYHKSEEQRLSRRQRLVRLKECKSVHCPNCQHDFKPGVSEDEVRQLEDEVNQIDKTMDSLSAEIKSLKSYIEEYEDYLGYVRSFRQLVQQSSTFRLLWDYCIEHRVMFRTPREYVTVATAWKVAMEALVSETEARQAREVIEHRLRYVEALDKDAIGHQERRRQQLEREIESGTIAAREAKAHQRRLQDFEQDMLRYQRRLSDTKDALATLLSDTEQQHTYFEQAALQRETQETQSRLAQTQESLSQAELREGLLKDLESQHEEATQTHHDYGILVKALAPTDGLIGRYLMGFMQDVVKLLNAVIAEIWTYRLEVLPSQVEKEELDYRFPLEVDDGAVTAPDISRGSSSQRDIVNFAFKLLAMKFLGLEDTPLYLDEFGSTFDEQHRENVIPFINQMVELGQVEQIFYISHFSAIHGAFNHADVCVLDSSNITTPETYNEHVIIR